MEQRICQNCKRAFTIKPEDFKFYEKMQVPPPTFCPECRLIRRLAWRNERTFYNRTCDKCKKPIISIYAPDSGLTVYCSPCWWKDDWDALDYGVDFDPQKPFFNQLRELYQRVPQMTLHGLYTTLVNSDYTHMVSYLKDCYLLTHSDVDENCMYGSFVDNSKDSIDNLMINKCEFCYESVNCQQCYQVFNSLDCENCQNVYFARNCRNCNDCFGCVNLRNKRYCIFNKQCSKEEYIEKLRSLGLESFTKREGLKPQIEKMWQSFPQKHIHERHSTNVTGDYIYNSKNTFDSFIASDVEDSRFCGYITPGGMKDCYDFTHFGPKSELLYESLQAGYVSKILFSWFVIMEARDVEYSMFNLGGTNNFGCAGLKKKKYCILNKQYSKEEYEALRARIIEQMNASPYKDKQGNEYRYGEFFPIELSPFGYNETTAQEFFPLSMQAATKAGYNWREMNEKNIQTTKKNDELPDKIEDVPESITQEIIECGHKGKCNEQCTKGFKIIPAELKFYRSMNISLPHLCPNCRHAQRIQFRTTLKLWQRACQCKGATNNAYINTASHFHGDTPCPNTFETAYSPERPDIIYCEQCYLAEVA